MKKQNNMRLCVASILLALSPYTNALEFSIPSELVKEYECMARNLFHEARGEGAKGMIAVANVVMNRVDDPKFPDTVCDVVYQKWQFTWTKTTPNTPMAKIDDKSKILAYEAVVNRSVKDNTNGALFYHASYTSFSWHDVKKIVPTGTIGNHIFYKFRKGAYGKQKNVGNRT